ncbi:MAG: YceI family protein [Actinomycetia bacterium]|nr:YceI family protein [Actinomycetes bacterium]
MTTETTLKAMRTVDGREVPAAGTWDFDPTHLSVTFEARHMMIAKVRGSFTAAEGTITVGDDPAGSSVEVSINTSSIESGSDERDAHLRSGDFLDVEKYPTMTYIGASLELVGDRYRLDGELTIKDVTRPVSLDLKFNGAIVDPWGNTRAAFSASSEIDRTEWDLTWNVPLETGGMLVGKTIKIVVEAEAVLRS